MNVYTHIRLIASLVIATTIHTLVTAQDIPLPSRGSQPLLQSSSKKTISTMSYEELKKTKKELIAAGYKDKAIKYLQRMLAIANDVNEVAAVMIEMADLYFEVGKLTKAEFLYEEFATLYPGNQYCDYARYKAVLCSFYSILEIDRDQTKTKETITRTERFLKQASAQSEYRQEVEKIAAKCHEHLFNSELKIARFYASQGRMAAATTRINNIEKDFSGKIANLKPRLLVAECDFARWNNDNAMLNQKATELATNFPAFVPPASSRTARKKTVLPEETPVLTAQKRDYVTSF